MTDPTPDVFGRYRVSEVVGGLTRHYSTASFIPGVHKIVPGPASYDNGDALPPKFNIREGSTAPLTNHTSLKEDTK